MDDSKPTKDFDASLPLPGGLADTTSVPAASNDDTNQAAELVRRKVEAAYQQAPSAATEAADLNQLGKTIHHSRHQQYIYDLTSSGKSLAEIQAAWREYYAGLTDLEKHQVWQEFYATHAQNTEPQVSPAASQTSLASDTPTPVVAFRQEIAKRLAKTKPVNESIEQLRARILKTMPAKQRRSQSRPVHSLFFGLGMGSLVVLVLLFSFFNERFIAPFIQPSRMLTNTPLITDNLATSSAPEVIIPKINVEIPVVYDVTTIDDTAIENALESGVVHYADTAMPGQNGNVVIVGHSSNNIFNKGRYKFAFVLLLKMDTGDTFYLQKDGKRYTYQIYEKKIVKPTDTSVLGTTDKPATATLITCDPPGTSINRLVVIGQQIDPNPSANTPQVTTNKVATESKIVPGNAPSLWSRLWGWFSR